MLSALIERARSLCYGPGWTGVDEGKLAAVRSHSPPRVTQRASLANFYVSGHDNRDAPLAIRPHGGRRDTETDS